MVVCCYCRLVVRASDSPETLVTVEKSKPSGRVKTDLPRVIADDCVMVVDGEKWKSAGSALQAARRAEAQTLVAAQNARPRMQPHVD